MIEKFIEFIPKDLYDQSGGVFYSGRNAFIGKKDLYVLGLNPGGSDKEQKKTIAVHTKQVLENPNPNWSEYSDVEWGKGRPAGTHGLQPRILHLLSSLRISPYNVPASNLCFVRSKNESLISGKLNELLEQCWTFHNKVIDELQIKVILCFGKTTGHFVRMKLNANLHIDTFTENNKRKWKSQAFQNDKGQVVIIATHPSRVDWTNPDTDPTCLIKKCMTLINE